MLYTRHGLNGTPDHKRWLHIKGRIYNKTDGDYHNYGGRGLTMCKLWRNNAELFVNYIKSLPNYGIDGLTIDRVNNDYGYQPMNLRWADKVTQRLNQRPTGTRVQQYSKDSELINSFESIREAARAIGANQSNLGKVIDHPTRTAKGFKWVTETATLK